MTNSVTFEQACRLFRYDPQTGKLFWRVKAAHCVHVGDESGSVHKASGYRQIKINNISYKAHRIIWLIVYGSFPDFEIDHINGIRNDNRLINLRSVTHAMNCRNRGMQSNNSSGIMGVSWCKRSNQWLARIYINGASKHLGYFDDMESAALSRKNAEKLYGFHSNHGDPDRIY